ncbi:HAD family hydrolase [Ruminococcus sp. FC2018]|uniref:HAD family hydrolase n=1 Tax=Ruminococcus sp. FC2018 TaxID=1410617 RepID=UPI00048E224B|nr:HAD family hydrolase [Ruminococcus sp. FC2018]
MSRYKFCIFDFDLTLADSSKAILTCYKHTLSKFGYDIPDDRTVFNTIGKTLVDSFDILTGIPDNPQREQLRVEYVSKADEVMAKDTVFYADTLAILQILQCAGVKVGIVSTKFRYRIEETFRYHTTSLPVDIIVGGEDVTIPKPDPQGLDLIISKFNADKRDVLYIGDSYIDAQTAVNAGVDFAAVTTGSTDKTEFEKYPHIYIGNSLTDVFQHI